MFALVGLLAGAAARLFYVERRLGQIAWTLALSLVGSLGGGANSCLLCRSRDSDAGLCGVRRVGELAGGRLGGVRADGGAVILLVLVGLLGWKVFGAPLKE